MAVEYKKYLAENVLNDRKTVTHRLLSRALKVHSHLAKQMLFEFHRTENSKSPHSVNATYVVTGIQNEPEEENSTSAVNGKRDDQDGEDQIMQSSPYISSSMPNQDSASRAVEKVSVVLVREEDLDDAKSTFQSISSIHVYSLQPNILPDLNVLADVSREILATYGKEDTLVLGKQWGMIQNRDVKRRTGARPPPPPTTQKGPVSAKQPVHEDTTPRQKKQEDKEDKNAVSGKPSYSEPSQNSSKQTEKAAPLKREKSDIFNSFAKAKQKSKGNSVTPAPSGSESAQPSGTEDVALGDASEEEEPEELFPVTGRRRANSSQETRKEREEKLKKMMEDDDQEMSDAADPAETPDPETTEQKEEQPQSPPKEEEPKEQVTVVGGRRRGRRQVTKKKTAKDEEGYLVTVEEPAWESFSEDEPAAPPKKKPDTSANKRKSVGKPGQGNIMSFFSKK